MPYPQFISCKVEQPLQGEELQKKKQKYSQKYPYNRHRKIMKLISLMS